MTKRKVSLYIIIAIGATVVAIISHIAVIMETLNNRMVPFRNIDIQGCYIYFQVQYRDSVAVVVMRSEQAHDIVIDEHSFLAPVTTIVLYDIMRYEIALDVSKRTFSRLKRHMVNTKLASRYKGMDLLNDTAFVDGGRLSEHIEGSEYNAIVYSLLMNGIACCVADETGTTLVGDVLGSGDSH